MSVVVVGPGRVGQSVAAALAPGREVTVAGPGPGPPAFLEGVDGVRWLGLGGSGSGGGRHAPPEDPAAGADTLLFCVPDDALPAAASAWSEAAAPAEGPARVALHTSGVHPPDVLSPLRSTGWSVGSWHPLAAVAAPGRDAFRGVAFGVAGDGPAVERARRLTEAVGGSWIRIGEGENARYHAAAVFASNFLVACLSVARRELEEATDADEGLAPLLPLARGALENLDPGDFASGVTGPVARGDAGTVRRHLAALDPGTARLYRGLARELLGVVEGRLDPDRARALREALGEGDAEGRGGGDGEGGARG